MANYQYLAQVQTSFPGLFMLATEATLKVRYEQLDQWGQGSDYAYDIIGDLNNGAAGWIEWNILLDQFGGPQHALGPCDAPILANNITKALEYGAQYWHMGHFSKFIPVNSSRAQLDFFESTLTGGLNATGVVTTSGQHVVVVLNQGKESVQYQLQMDAEVATVTIPANGIQTLIF